MTDGECLEAICELIKTKYIVHGEWQWQSIN
jgi:hypothetical protein